MRCVGVRYVGVRCVGVRYVVCSVWCVGMYAWERGGSNRNLSFAPDVSTATKLPESDLQDRRCLHQHYATSSEKISG